jgi:hypothetical protein
VSFPREVTDPLRCEHVIVKYPEFSVREEMVYSAYCEESEIEEILK